MRLASFNVENLFSRAKALNTPGDAAAAAALAAYTRFNTTADAAVYSGVDKKLMIEDLTTLGVLVQTPAGLRPARNPFAAWALLRENRGDFIVLPEDREPRIVAGGRGDWIGWVELIVEPVDEVATQMTAKVITDLAADVQVLVEAEDRPSLVRFNHELLADRFAHAMLIDGNDPRGIDVGLYATGAVELVSMRSHVDLPDPAHPEPDRKLFSRDCPVHQLRLGATELWVLPNHLKSQAFSPVENPDELRSRQSRAVRDIYDHLRGDGIEHIAVLGDFNKAPDPHEPSTHPTLEALFADDQLVDAYSLPGFDPGPRPGTYGPAALKDRLDYILLSPALAAKFTAGGVWRKGHWGGHKNPPTDYAIYPEITRADHAASDHAAIWVDLDLT